MNFKCFICLKGFETIDKTITHLKKIHFMRNNAHDLKCVVNFPNNTTCDRLFKTFDALKKHSMQCNSEENLRTVEKEVKIFNLKQRIKRSFFKRRCIPDFIA